MLSLNLGPGHVKRPRAQDIDGDGQTVARASNLRLPPEVHDSLRTAIEVAMAADHMMTNLGARATEAVCQSVRIALDAILERLSVTEAASILKDVPMGMKVKSGKLIISHLPRFTFKYRYCTNFVVMQT